MEEEISSLYRVIQEARVTKAELEEQMEMMRQELRTLEQNHEQVESSAQLQGLNLTLISPLVPVSLARVP